MVVYVKCIDFEQTAVTVFAYSFLDMSECLVHVYDGC